MEFDEYNFLTDSFKKVDTFDEKSTFYRLVQIEKTVSALKQ